MPRSSKPKHATAPVRAFVLNRATLIAGIVAVAGVLGAGGWWAYQSLAHPDYTLTAVAERVQPQRWEAPEIDFPEDGPVEFTVLAAGDVLPHGSVIQSGRSGSSYDFNGLFDGVREWTRGADLALCHMEVPVAPNGVAPSGYPIFGAPRELVRDLGEEGWDGCSTASNHSVDRGWDGLVATVDAFKDYRLGYVGTATTRDEALEPQIYNVRTGNRVIKVAHLSWSYGTNGLPVPSGKSWSVNVFDSGDAEVAGMLAQAQSARDAGADVVILSVHCCVEYNDSPTADQRAIATKVADSGLVDLMIGHHAHVPQPITKLAGGPDGDGMWVAYGLGNYVSNQGTNCCRKETSSGALLIATFRVELDGTTHVDAEWAATTVDRTNGHRVYMLADITNGTGDLSKSEVADRYRRIKGVVNSGDAPERTEPPTKLADAVYISFRGPYVPNN